MIQVIILVTIVGGLLVWAAVSEVLTNDTEKDCIATRADSYKSIPPSVDMMKYEREFCSKCKFYDGYDMCLHKSHWGTVIQNTVELCKRSTGNEIKEPVTLQPISTPSVGNIKVQKQRTV